MPRYRLDLEYDGAAFAGWQLQPSQVTVQGALEDAIAQVLGRAARVHGAGRTDSGVHALAQVAVFDVDVDRDPRAVRDGLNAALPPAVAVTKCEIAPADFDPRRAPHTKTYRYRWLVRPTRSPLRAGRAWHVRQGLDVSAMHEGALLLRGTHDFSAFRAQGCSAATTVRTIERAVVEAHDDEIWLELDGTGFLRHMVRIVAGTLYDIGRGAAEPSRMASVLRSGDRTNAGRTAPAFGLELAAIRYH